MKAEEFERRMDFFMRTNRVIPKIKLTTRSGIVLVNPDDVMLIRSEGNYCRLFLKDGREEQITQNIVKVAEALDSPNILKANRSAYINLQ